MSLRAITAKMPAGEQENPLQAVLLTTINESLKSADTAVLKKVLKALGIEDSMSANIAPDTKPADPSPVTESIQETVKAAVDAAIKPLLEENVAISKELAARKVLEAKGAAINPQLLEELTKCADKAAMDVRTIPAVVFTDPEVAWVGLTEDQAKAQGIKVKKGLFPWTASGRAIANGRDEGFTKLLFDDSPEAHGHGKILGGGIVGTHAGDMIGEIALAIEMGADAVDIGKTIHPHPTLGESIGMAAEVAHGSCTDVPPSKK